MTLRSMLPISIPSAAPRAVCVMLVLGLALPLIGCGSSGDDIPDGRLHRIDAIVTNIDATVIAHDDAASVFDATRPIVDGAPSPADARAINSIDAAASRPDATKDARSASFDAAPAVDATASASCGNHIVDPGEQCDDGAANSDTGACRSDCTFATCGDGFVETGVEVCDDGTNGPGTCCAADCSAHLTCSGGGINFSTGNIAGSVLWNGAPVTNDPYLMVNNPTTGSAYTHLDGSYALSNVAVGSYVIGVFENECGNPYNHIGQSSSSVVVSGGSTTAADIDITNSAGLLTGTITVNGVAISGGYLQIENVACSEVYLDGNGQFHFLLPPGSYVASVFTSANAALGSFSFSITAGQATSYDSVPTDAGANVSNAAAGGSSTRGGIELIFATVSTAGTTTVASSGTGPDAPDGLAIVGIDDQPRYWDVSTSAVVSGAIEFCVQYDPTQVNGPINTLELVDASNGFIDLTTSVNTTTNIICGTTTTLSTFAVVDQPF